MMLKDLYFTNEQGEIITPDENGLINMLPFMNEKIFVHVLIQPMYYLREISVKGHHKTSFDKVAKHFFDRKTYNFKVNRDHYNWRNKRIFHIHQGKHKYRYRWKKIE